MQQIIEVKTIRYMLAIEREGGFQKAAEALYISQPALSQYIRRIEDSLGFRLYERGKGRCVPTEAGKVLLSCGRSLLRDYNAMLEKVNAAAGITDVHIGWPTGYTVRFFNKLFSYMAAHELSKITYTEDVADQLLLLLLEGKLDMIFVPVYYSHPDIEYTTIQHEEFYLTVPRQHEANAVLEANSRDGYVDLNLVLDQPFIMIDARAYEDFVEGLFRDFPHGPKVRLTVKDWGRAYLLSEEGAGLSILPYWYAEKPDKDLAFYRIRSPHPNARIFACAKLKRTAMSRGMQAVLDYMLKNYGDEHAGEQVAEDVFKSVFRF